MSATATLPSRSAIKVTDEKPCFALPGANVDIFVNPGSRPEERHGSSRVKLKNIVDYKWEVKKYFGRLIAVHRDGQIIAYSIKLKTGGMVRVVWNGERALIKGMSTEVLDLQFAHMSKKIILACVDDTSLHVYRVDISAGKLETTLLLKVNNATEDVPLYSHRINWCPFVPSSNTQTSTAIDSKAQNKTITTAAVMETDENAAEDGEEEDFANHLLVWRQGDTFQALNVHLVVEAHGAGNYEYAELSEGVVQHQESKSIITVATFSPDGTTLAVGSADGNVYFYQIYLYSKEQAPRRLYNWRPHDTKPVTALVFLDDHTTENGAFWKHALTATDNNTEIKLWRCDDWSCIQRICFKPTAIDMFLDFKLEVDASSSYLVLSEQQNRVMYALQIAKKDGETGTATTAVTSTVALTSIGEFPLSSPILSFSIASATKGKYSCGRLEDEEEDEDVFDVEDEEQRQEEGVMLQMFLVQPKSVQECQLFFQTEHPVQPESVAIADDDQDLLKQRGWSMGPGEMELATPDVQKTKSELVFENITTTPSNNTNNNRQKSSAQINLMTPESFQSPPQTNAQQSSSEAVSNAVLTTIRMLAASTAASGGDKQVKSLEPSQPAMISYATLEEQNKSLRQSLSVSEAPSTVSLVPIASSTVNNSEILPSGNSSPSREVQEILSLKDEMFENAGLQSSDLDIELEVNSSVGGSGCTSSQASSSDEVDDDTVQVEEEENVIKGIDAIKLYVDDDEEDDNNSNTNRSKVMQEREWPKVPNILPEMAIRINESENNLTVEKNKSSTLYSMNNLSGVSTQAMASSGSLGGSDVVMASKLDRILDKIESLERRFDDWEQQQQKSALISRLNSSQGSEAGSGCAVDGATGGGGSVTNEKLLNKALDSHLMRCENLIKYELNDVHKKQTQQLNMIRDQLMHTVNQVVTQQFPKRLLMELNPPLMGLVAREMENIKGMIQYEVANKLSVSDKLLQENLKFVCTNQNLMESFAAAIRSGVQHTVQVTFIEQINTMIIPAYERATKEMFKQTNEMFQKGVNNCEY